MLTPTAWHSNTALTMAPATLTSPGSASGPVIDGTGYNLDLYVKVKVTPAPTPAPTSSCPETCYGYTCDFWGQHGYSCSVLNSTYRCD